MSQEIRAAARKLLADKSNEVRSRSIKVNKNNPEEGEGKKALASFLDAAKGEQSKGSSFGRN